MKSIIVGIVGIAIAASVMSYINFIHNQELENKYVYLQRDVKQLTKEISALHFKIAKQQNVSAEQSTLFNPNLAKNYSKPVNLHKQGVNSAHAKSKGLAQQQLTNTIKARKKHLGMSMATN